MKKPEWLSKKINLPDCRAVKELIRETGLHTVCEEAFCPNIGECFHEGTASFMILGNICTRGCSFCATAKGIPLPADNDEPQRVKEAVKRLNLRYVVITSPTRDDLDDKGAGIFCATVKKVKELKDVKVELLIPDFQGKIALLKDIACSGADVISHNLETVPSLYIKVRQGSGYRRSLKVLETVKDNNSKVYTKSGLMLGLGEKKEEMSRVFKDLRKANCDFLTLGQYLPPSQRQYPVQEYIPLERFEFFEKEALSLGFKKVRSSPYTRSSYLADSFLNG